MWGTLKNKDKNTANETCTFFKPVNREVLL